MTFSKTVSKTLSNINSPLRCFLHIYKVAGLTQQNLETVHYVSVASLGQTRAAAETVAINLVHQSGYHILATDTATAAPWLTEDEDLPYLQDLERYGASLQELVA